MSNALNLCPPSPVLANVEGSHRSRYWFWVLPELNQRHLTPAVRDVVVRQVAAEHGVPQKDVLSLSRLRKVVHARQAAMWRLRLKGYSSAEIGRSFNRDHATVLWAFDRHIERAGLQPQRVAA